MALMIVVGTLRPMVNEEERRGTMIKSHELVRVIIQSSEALASEIKEKPRARGGSRAIASDQVFFLKKGGTKLYVPSQGEILFIIIQPIIKSYMELIPCIHHDALS